MQGVWYVPEPLQQVVREYGLTGFHFYSEMSRDPEFQKQTCPKERLWNPEASARKIRGMAASLHLHGKGCFVFWINARWIFAAQIK